MSSVPSAPGPSRGEEAPPRTLGVGFPYISVLPPDLYRPGLIDFVEITPESLCRARRDGGLNIIPEKLEQARVVCGEFPIVVHGVDLSIGSAREVNTAYLDMLDRFQDSWPFLWHSEHLSYQTIPAEDGAPISIGTPLPLPGAAETVGLVAARAAVIRRRYGVPFLLENPAHYLTGLPYETEIGDEIGLMTAITEQSGCGQLLDLHNLYCNAVNLGFDAFAAIDRTRLDRVIEIHVAGGRLEDGFWMDAHDSRVPNPVWKLLEYTLPRCPNIAGVVFELLDFYALKVGTDAIAEALSRVRDLWRSCRHDLAA
jgi:uncharacterized protein (UPF0276 family)